MYGESLDQEASERRRVHLRDMRASWDALRQT